MKKGLILLIILLCMTIKLRSQEKAIIHVRYRPIAPLEAFANQIRIFVVDKCYIGQLTEYNSQWKIETNPGTILLEMFSKEQYDKNKNSISSFSTHINVQSGEEYYVYLDALWGSKIVIEDKSKVSKYKKNESTLDLDLLKVQQGVSFDNLSYQNQTQKDQVSITENVQSPNQTKQPLQSSIAHNQHIQTLSIQLSDVDVDIPKSNIKADNTFVLIIANEEYQFLDNVNYATHDGEVFREYCIKTLGVPERQVRYCSNASYGIISGGVDWLRYALENFEGSRGMVYYCGHGIPDERSNEAYIIPVDGKGTNMATCYSLNELYKTLAATNATNITYFMDACFTGANKEGSMLVAARGVAREPKKETLEGKTVVFSASSGDETAMTYEEKQHGLFTYYLLKKLQETSGDVSYEELANYISKNVKKDAFLLNEKPQNPVVATSIEASSSWKSMRMK